jgi:hypothetical protein
VVGVLARWQTFHKLHAEIPIAAWVALVEDAERQGASVSKLLIRHLQDIYKIPASKIPKRRRAGRKPKRIMK